jgi:hypothetical protein
VMIVMIVMIMLLKIFMKVTLMMKTLNTIQSYLNMMN